MYQTKSKTPQRIKLISLQKKKLIFLNFFMELIITKKSFKPDSFSNLTKGDNILRTLALKLSQQFFLWLKYKLKFYQRGKILIL